MTERFADSTMPDLAKAAAAGGPAGPAAQVVVDVDGEEAFAALVAQSNTVPVVIDLWATWCEPCKQLSPVLEKVAREFGGRLLLAKIDVDRNQAIAAAFGAQSIPTVVAVVKGQPVPLFQGALPEPQVRQFFEELLKAAAGVGVTGSVAGGAAEPAAPPAHREGYEALERGDLAAAKAAFASALAQAPADAAAKAALAQVELLERLAEADQAADGTADGVEAVMDAADADVAAGRFAVGFSRLLEAIRTAAPEDVDRLRLRLLDLFAVAGPDEPAVAQARRRLTGLLF
ncbi:MAG: tetratricopeptide repeat protein [Bifidobacteriaceae bacterium]|jgi:putative thioredoxin|nr:tetratricopeptide repeat protein [Bifidobacteriaceae bacterium]